jgi:hypothetical protein
VSDEPHDPLPAMLADLDQALSMVPMLSSLHRGLYDGFRKEGFTDEQALRLTIAQMDRLNS